MALSRPPPSLSYAETVRRLPGAEVVRPGLERTRLLLEALGRPDRGLVGVLVGGTNGKGSVCAIVDSICRAAGLRTVMLTNPHLTSYCERIVVRGRQVAEPEFAGLVGTVLAAAPEVEAQAGPPSQFEMLTAAGVLAAARSRAEVVICEVGMGGRLDSTNVLDLGVAAITNVSLDHEAQLGSSPAAIAAEKAQIIKPGNAVATAAEGPALKVISDHAATVGAELMVVGRELTFEGRSRGRGGLEAVVRIGRGPELALELPLAGGHQGANLAVAVGACELLRRRGLALEPEAISAGAAGVRWPGRLQWCEGRPDILLDGAHNPAGMRSLVEAADELCRGRRVVALFGAMADKRTATMLGELSALTRVAVLTRVRSQRARAPAELLAEWPAEGLVSGGSGEGLSLARRLAGPSGVVLVCGSLLLVGEILDQLGTELTRRRGGRPASP